MAVIPVLWRRGNGHAAEAWRCGGVAIERLRRRGYRHSGGVGRGTWWRCGRRVAAVEAWVKADPLCSLASQTSFIVAFWPARDSVLEYNLKR